MCMTVEFLLFCIHMYKCLPRNDFSLLHSLFSDLLLLLLLQEPVEGQVSDGSRTVHLSL